MKCTWFVALVLLSSQCAEALCLQRDQLSAFAQAPGGLSDAPKLVQALAKQILGDEMAAQFGDNATRRNVKINGRLLKIWNHKLEKVPDFNPTPTYRWNDLEHLSGGLAIDVGANLGDTAIIAHILNPSLQIISLEPSPFNYLFMRWNLIENGIPEINETELKSGKAGVFALNAALTSDGRQIDIAYWPGNSKQTQIQNPVTGFGDEVPKSMEEASEAKQTSWNASTWVTFKVPSVSLPVWLEAHHVPPISWFKIDCEGCEYEVLNEIHAKGLLANAIVVGEAHPRHIADLSCKDSTARPECQAMLLEWEHSRKLMCKTWHFQLCQWTMRCGPYDMIRTLNECG